MHTSHGVCHTVGSRSCSHVIRMKGTSCTTTGSYGEVFLSCFYTFFFVGSCNRVLETCRVGGVSCDRNVNAFFPHDRNAFTHVICTVAVYFGAQSVRVRNSLYFLKLACKVIILCLYIGKSIDSGDDLCSIFSKSVQDYTEWFFTYFVCFLCNTDCSLCCCEGLVSCQEAEAVCCFLKEHFSKVTVSKPYLTLISNGSRNTECLQSFSDSCCRICCSLASFLDRDCRTCDVSPACIFKADRLDAFDLVIYIQSGIFCDLFSFF